MRTLFFSHVVSRGLARLSRAAGGDIRSHGSPQSSKDSIPTFQHSNIPVEVPSSIPFRRLLQLGFALGSILTGIQFCRFVAFLASRRLSITGVLEFAEPFFKNRGGR